MDAVSSGVDMAMGAFSKSWLEKYARQELGGLIEAAVDRALKRYRARLQSRMGSQRALQSRSVIAGDDLAVRVRENNYNFMLITIEDEAGRRQTLLAPKSPRVRAPSAPEGSSDATSMQESRTRSDSKLGSHHQSKLQRVLRNQLFSKIKHDPQGVDTGMYFLGTTGTKTRVDNTGKEYTCYDITCAHADARGASKLHVLRMRYSSLSKLNADLRKAGIRAPRRARFPPKKFFGRMDSTFIKNRCEQIGKWLQWLAVLLRHNPNAMTLYRFGFSNSGKKLRTEQCILSQAVSETRVRALKSFDSSGQLPDIGRRPLDSTSSDARGPGGGLLLKHALARIARVHSRSMLQSCDSKGSFDERTTVGLSSANDRCTLSSRDERRLQIRIENSLSTTRRRYHDVKRSIARVIAQQGPQLKTDLASYTESIMAGSKCHYLLHVMNKTMRCIAEQHKEELKGRRTSSQESMSIDSHIATIDRSRETQDFADLIAQLLLNSNAASRDPTRSDKTTHTSIEAKNEVWRSKKPISTNPVCLKDFAFVKALVANISRVRTSSESKAKIGPEQLIQSAIRGTSDLKLPPFLVDQIASQFRTIGLDSVQRRLVVVAELGIRAWGFFVCSLLRLIQPLCRYAEVYAQTRGTKLSVVSRYCVDIRSVVANLGSEVELFQSRAAQECRSAHVGAAAWSHLLRSLRWIPSQLLTTLGSILVGLKRVLLWPHGDGTVPQVFNSDTILTAIRGPCDWYLNRCWGSIWAAVQSACECVASERWSHDAGGALSPSRYPPLGKTLAKLGLGRETLSKLLLERAQQAIVSHVIEATLIPFKGRLLRAARTYLPEAEDTRKTEF